MPMLLMRETHGASWYGHHTAPRQETRPTTTGAARRRVGNGDFIDMAWMARKIARQTGQTRPATFALIPVGCNVVAALAS